MLVPGSHIAVDETAIKFHGRKRDIYRMAHKPAKQGFTFYAVASPGGMLHDFLVSSSQDGIEGIPDGISIDLPTRTVRMRQRGHTGATAVSISLPPTKALVYVLMQRLTQQVRTELHLPTICFVGNRIEQLVRL